ncbi:MAG TPA: hypothetical protein VK898_17915, partial [Chloroflexota bacterium]|nr:hypothetical protein [Chloroflexota bacterium]
FYVGACPDRRMTLNDVHAENAPQGYSGTNSGGHVLVKNSEFDQNMTGFATGDLNNDDAPSPQEGTCPNNARNPYVTSGFQRTNVCWTFINNYVHDNNNANVPVQGIAGLAVPGTGMTIYGGRHDLFLGNRFVNNGGWGVVFVPFPDTEQPPPVAHCQGGVDLSTPNQPLCWFDDWGSEFANNTFTHNGYFGNPSNGDIAEYSQQGPQFNPDSNCFHGNVDTAGVLTSAPANIDNNNVCGRTYNSSDATFAFQIACASSALFTCPPGTPANYPKSTGVHLKLPPPQRAMPNPCAGAPVNPWCSGQVSQAPRCVRRGGRLRVHAVLATRERLLHFTARIGRHGRKFRAHGRVVRVKLGKPSHRRVRVTFTELIQVGKARERFRFTRVYKLCA